MQRIALQRNDDLRQQFKAEISVFNPNQLVFLDETGIVCILRNDLCCHTYILMVNIFIHLVILFVEG